MLYPKSKIVLGACFFLPGDGAYTVGATGLGSKNAASKPGMYFYLMPIFNF